MVLTRSRNPFIHSGQEYGVPNNSLIQPKTPVLKIRVPNKSPLAWQGRVSFVHPYFYPWLPRLSDAVNKFWLDRQLTAKHILKCQESWLYERFDRPSSIDRCLPTKSLQDIKERVRLITVPGQNGVEKKMWPSATKSLLQTVMSTLPLSIRMIRLMNLLWNCICHWERLKSLADENQGGPVGIAKPLKGTERPEIERSLWSGTKNVHSLR